MSDFGRELSRLMDARGIGVRELARAVPCNPGHVSNLRSGKARPSPELAADLDERLGAEGRLAALAQPVKRGGLVVAGDDEIAAIELARRAQLSDVGAGTCERIELAVDDLAVAYPRTAPGVLLPRVRAHLAYVTRLLDGRATLAERRRLIVSAGWLSLLAATLLIDSHQDHAGNAYPACAKREAPPPVRTGRGGASFVRAWVISALSAFPPIRDFS